MVSLAIEMMQTAGASDPLSQESAYLRSMGYPHPDPLNIQPHHHHQMQLYEEEGDEKSGANMNLGPRTWYQVPHRDLRYPEFEDPHHPHHLQYGLPPMPAVPNVRRSHGLSPTETSGLERGMDMMDGQSSDEDSQDQKPMIHGGHEEYLAGAGRGKPIGNGPATPTQGKKTKGRVKIKMEFIDNKLRRYTTFSKRKTGIMKKAYELSTLTGTQVMLLVASETGHVYTFATRKLQPMITSDTGKALIQTCLNSPDPPLPPSADQRMSATGYEETELTYNVNEDEQQKVRQMMYSSHYSAHPPPPPQHPHHNLFSPPGTAQYPPPPTGGVSHPAYITPVHPAPSPSPSSSSLHLHSHQQQQHYSGSVPTSVGGGGGGPLSMSPSGGVSSSHSPTHLAAHSPGPYSNSLGAASQHHSVR